MKKSIIPRYIRHTDVLTTIYVRRLPGDIHQMNTGPLGQGAETGNSGSPSRSYRTNRLNKTSAIKEQQQSFSITPLRQRA
jgi:hypothetical protein